MRTIILAVAIAACTAANAQSDDDFEARLDEYLNVSPLKEWAMLLQTECVNTWARLDPDLPHADSYREVIRKWALARSKRQTKLADLYENLIKLQLKDSDRILSEMEQAEIKTKEDRDVYWDWYIEQCEISGLKELARGNR